MTEKIRARKRNFTEAFLNDNGDLMDLNTQLISYDTRAQLSIYNYNKKFAEETLKYYREGDIKKFNENADIYVNLNVEEIYFMDWEEKQREINKYKNFFDNFLDKDTKERLHIVMGETGTGKSYMIEKNLPNIIQYACNSSLDPYTLSYELKDEGNGLQPFETPFLKAIKEGGKIFLDEMNELPMDTLMFIQGITDEKKSVVIGNQSIDIHPEFRIIGSLNPPSATDERRPLGDALLGRAVGIVLELSDDELCKRIGCSKDWLRAVRKLHEFMRQANFVDLRNLNFRDYQRLYKYDFLEQYKFKVCMGDVVNIAEWANISISYEFDETVKQINKARLED